MSVQMNYSLVAFTCVFSLSCVVMLKLESSTLLLGVKSLLVWDNQLVLVNELPGRDSLQSKVTKYHLIAF